MSDPLHSMRATPQWITWRLLPPVAPSTKPRKVPFNSRTGAPASTTDPSTWSTHAQAAAAGNPGFVFTAADPWWFVDLDGALLPDGTWSPLATSVCQALRGAAVEVSQSGRGLHLFGRGKLPPHCNKNAEHHAELYTTERYAAITGNGLVGDCDTDHTAAITALALTYFPPRATGTGEVPDDGPRADWCGPTDDEELLRRAMRSRSAAAVFGGKASFADLWTANVGALAAAYPPNGSSSDSYGGNQADAALAQHLAYWTGCNVARIERLMRRSALARDKWDRHSTYLVELTITKACQLQREVLQDAPTPEAPVAEPERLTLAAAEQQLRNLTRDEVMQAWLPLALRLSNADAEAFVSFTESQSAVGRAALKATLRDARKKQRQSELRDQLAATAAGRTSIEWLPANSSDIASTIEGLIVDSAEPGAYVTFGGQLSHVTKRSLPFTHSIDDADSPPPAVPQVGALNDVAVLAHVQRVVQLHEESASGPRPIAVPAELIAILLKKSVHHAPGVTGLLTHPVALPNGEILHTDGLHARTGLFLMGAGVEALRPYDHAESLHALRRVREALLDGFEFASSLDADVAVAGLFTGVQRRLMDSAPGLAVVASTQASGKTTLVRRIHIVLTGHDMPASTFPKDETEFQKQMLSTLMRSPALVCFDNLADGSMLRSAALAAAMTSASIDQRVLGASKNATPQTNVLFALTGNNVTLGPDEASRWLVCRLAPKGARPETRVFAHSDVVAHGLRVRAALLRDVVGIVAGYALAGARAQSGGSRFPRWDQMVRQPLMWAGGSDVAAVFAVNADANPEALAFAALLQGLTAAFGHKGFKAAAVLDPALALSVGSDIRSGMVDAFETLSGKRPESPVAVGRALAARVGRVITLSGQDVRLQVMQGPDKAARYFVERVSA